MQARRAFGGLDDAEHVAHRRQVFRAAAFELAEKILCLVAEQALVVDCRGVRLRLAARMASEFEPLRNEVAIQPALAAADRDAPPEGS